MICASPASRLPVLARANIRQVSHRRAVLVYGRSSRREGISRTRRPNRPASGPTDLAHRARPRERECSRPAKRPFRQSGRGREEAAMRLSIDWFLLAKAGGHVAG